MAERPIDIVHALRPQSASLPGAGAGSSKKNPLDEAIEARQRRLLEAHNEREWRRVELQDERDLLALEKETNALKGGGKPGSEEANPALSLVAKLVKEGLETSKAVATVQAMPPAQVMQLWTMSQSQGAGPYMASLIAAAQNAPGPRDAIGEFREIYKLFKEQQPEQRSSSIEDFRTLYEMVKPGREVDETISHLYSKQEDLEKALANEREERHKNEVTHANEMAEVRQRGMEDRIKELSAKIDGGAGKGDTLSMFKKNIEELKAIGLPIAVGAEVAAKSPMEEANALVKTVVESPGMQKVFDAASDRVRTGGFSRNAAAGPGRPPPAPGQQVLCDNCLAQGKRTPLSITPEVLAGKAPVTCTVCGQTYWRGTPPPPPPSGSGQPPKGPGTDERPYFPGRF